LNAELIHILDDEIETKNNILTEDKIVNIKLLRTYLDDLNLHKSQFQMNKFVVKQKKLKNVVDFSSEPKNLKHSVKKNKSIYSSYKQVLLEDKQNNTNTLFKSSIYRPKESFHKAYHRYDSSFNHDNLQDDNVNRVNGVLELIKSLKRNS
jgi:hypothetical protein